MKKLLYILTLISTTIFTNAQDVQKKVYVSNEVEFVNALNDNTNIIIKADTLNFSEKNLEKLLGEKRRNDYFVPKKSYFVTNGLVLYGYKNLTIQGKKHTTLYTDDYRGDILTLEKCNFVTLKNITFLTLKHLHTSSISLSIFQSNNIIVENIKSLQSGNALYALGASNISFKNTIFNTKKEHSIIKAINSKNITFNQSSIKRDIPLKFDRSNGRIDVEATHLYKNDFIENKNSDITFIETTVNNQKITHKKTGAINDINYATTLKYKIREREKNITHFINSLEEITSGKNYNPKYLTSFFNDELEELFDVENATLKDVYNYFFQTFYISRDFKLVSIIPFNENSYYVDFVEKKILNDNDYNEIQETHYYWTIRFNKHNYFSNISTRKSKKEYKSYIGLPKIPKLKNKDLQASLLWCNEYISAHYLRFALDPEIDKYPTAFLDETVYQLNHFSSNNNLGTENPLSTIDKEDVIKMNTYLKELKQFSWYDLLSRLNSNYEEYSNEYLSSLLSAFENIWAAYIYINIKAIKN